MHEVLAEKIKYKVSDRLEEEGKEEAAEIAEEAIDDFFQADEEPSKKKVVEALRNVQEELIEKQRRESPRRIDENIWDLF